MDKTTNDRLLQEIRASPVMAKLEAMARDLAGVVLLVFVRRGELIEELYATGRPAVLPHFCRLVRTSAEGRRRCATCRQLIAFGASYRGLAQFSCHGGVSLLAAPGDRGAYDPAESIVVTSCAFADANPVDGWRAARSHARGLPVDVVRLREAYLDLPRLTEEKVGLVKAIVDLAAAAVDDIRRRIMQSLPVVGAHGARTERELEARIGEALSLPQAARFRGRGMATGNTLVRFVVAMVSRDPALPFTVANIARAARITPNHFSSLFRKHTGKAFVSFLTAHRLDLAKKHLTDLRLNVSEVAERSGFRDASYFGKRFKEATGRTPEDWRQRGHRM